MNILLDTCTFIWMATSPSHLSKRARDVLSAPGYTLILSVISMWEIALKVATKQMTLKEDKNTERFVGRYRTTYNVLSLPLQEMDIAELDTLPSKHKDPFDRMLICQAKANNLTILTPDKHFAKYDVKVLW